ncbi:MAG: polymer-forming cytoskeletal protein [Thermoplasmata archaeon]
MVFDKKTLVIPDNVKFEEHNIVSKGDFIIGDRANFGLGIITDGRVFIGEKTKVKGNITTKDDIRIDMWTQVEGDVTGGKNVFLADKVKIKGKVSVGRDLDLSDSAEIGKFEAKGWINVRSPISLIIYVYLYLLELMKQGRSQEVEMILDELDGESEEFIISDVFTFVPNDSEITLQRAKIKGNCWIGENCRILGNYSVSGYMKIGSKTKFHGSIEAGKDLDIGSNSEIVGSITSKGTVTIDANTHIHGNVKAKSVEIRKSVVVEGKIQAQDGLTFTTPESKEMKVKVERFERGLDDYEAVLD